MKMDFSVDKRVLRGLLNHAIQAREKMVKEKERLYKKYDRIVYRELNKMARNAIKEFYGSIHGTGKPWRYHRKRDLYNTYEITAKNGIWDFKIGPEYMKKEHKIGNDYIYWQTMIMGSHGGAWREEYNDFFWRTPHPDYTEWWDDPTEKYFPDGGINMEDYILNFADDIMDYQEQLRQEEYEKIMDPVFEDLLDRVSRL